MFDWDDGNVEHIARHGVEWDEAEEALLDSRRVRAVAYSVPGERRTGVVGRTMSGRLLYVVFTRRGAMLRVVTARDADERDRRRYWSRGK